LGEPKKDRARRLKKGFYRGRCRGNAKNFFRRKEGGEGGRDQSGVGGRNERLMEGIKEARGKEGKYTTAKLAVIAA